MKTPSQNVVVGGLALAFVALLFLAWLTDPEQPQIPRMSGCQPHIEVQSAAFWATELGRSEEWVLQNHRIALWERHGSNRGSKTGELLPGSRAVVLDKAPDGNYRVQSPLDKSTGWISDVQVARMLRQDVSTRRPC